MGEEDRRLVAGDLADSDEEELSAYGRQVQEGIKGRVAREGAPQHREQQQKVAERGEGRGGMARPADALPAEKRLEGKAVITERFSRIRITNAKVVTWNIEH